MDTTELAKITCNAINEAAKKVGPAAFDVNIFLQEDMPKMYGVHCDLSYGGTEAADEAVRDELPNGLFDLDCGDSDIGAEFESAMEKAWDEQDWAC